MINPDAHTGFWVYLNGIGNDNWNSINGRYYGRIDFSTSGEFIGLKDKDGRDIYTGDIMMIEQINGEKYVAPVEYKSVSFCVKVEGDHYVINFPENDWEVHRKYYEIIGNIYENPELLK